MAEQEEPIRRRVALKVIKLGMDTRQVIARFQAERQALALMDHPNIAKVLDAGATETGRPYFVMELVRGVRITDYCEEHKRSIPERLELFMQVCAAVQHAHQKGIIHRDIKPSNVLVMVQDNKPVPKVIDFGIAKAMAQRLTDKTLFTAFQQVIGTPAYMSPEQAGANREDIDTRSDIYSLGVLLYELLTGKTPFETRKLMEAGLEAIFKTIREEEPPKPSARLTTLTKEELAMVAARRRTAPERLGKLVRGEPDWIVMKCLEKDRTRRYDTANGLALDIQRHLTNEPVVAAPQSMAYRLQRLVRRHRVALVTASAFLLVLLSGIVMSTWQWRRAVVAQGGEAHQRRVAETNAVQRREQLVRLDVANGVRAMENDDWFGALLWFTEALRQDQPGSRAEAMHRYRIGALLTYTPRLTQVWSHGGPINHATFSPDGLWALTSSRDQTTRPWNVLTGQPGAVLPHGRANEGNKPVASGSPPAQIGGYQTRLWNVETGQPVTPPLGETNEVTRMEFSPDGRWLLTVANAGGDFALAVRLWSSATGTAVTLPIERTGFSPEVVFSRDGRRLFIVGLASEPIALELPGGRVLHASEWRGFEMQPLAVTADGQRFATHEKDGVRVHDALTGEPLSPPLRNDGELSLDALTFSPDGSVLLARVGDRGQLWPLPREDRPVEELTLLAGTPQGWIISPTLANLTLDGLEQRLKDSFFETKRRGKRHNPKVNFVRYADDFIITGSTKELLENEVKPLVEQFLRDRGLQLSSEKTCITHITQGFDFLGQNLRKFGNKMLTQPSRKNTHVFLEKVRQIIRRSGGMGQSDLIRQLNPVIRGWANYHRFSSATRTFRKVEWAMWHSLWQWAKRRHAGKGARWIFRRYWHPLGNRVAFAAKTGKQTSSGQPLWLKLVYPTQISIRRFVKIRMEANPFDPNWRGYFEDRAFFKKFGIHRSEAGLKPSGPPAP